VRTRAAATALRCWPNERVAWSKRHMLGALVQDGVELHITCCAASSPTQTDHSLLARVCRAIMRVRPTSPTKTATRPNPPLHAHPCKQRSLLAHRRSHPQLTPDKKRNGWPRCVPGGLCCLPGGRSRSEYSV
jgi:hypothetical protein